MMDNASVISMLTLSWLSGASDYRLLIFALTLLCYAVIWLVNLTIVVTVAVDPNLHQPMYILLCNLCLNGLYGTSGFYPKFLKDLLYSSHVISYAGCLAQGFVLHSSACADFSLLALMAYDRYVAICRPLAYQSVMTKPRVCVLVFFAWMIPLSLLLMATVTTVSSRLCGSHIPKIYCVNWLLGRLACSSSLANVIVPAFNYTFYFAHIIFIAWTYVYMIRTCLTSRKNRSKFLSTCLPHLISLVIVVASLLFDLLYMRFGSKDISQSLKNFVSIEFLLIPPVVNPLLYGFRLTQIRKRIQSFMCRKS